MELNFQNMTKGRKFELKPEGTTEKEASLEEYPNQSSICTAEYSEIKLIPAERGASSMEHSNYNNTFVDEYSEIKLIPAALPPKLTNMEGVLSVPSLT